MIKLRTVVSALVALCAGAAPATAQVAAGNSGSSDVQVDWSVLDRLGPPPNIAGMIIRQSAAPTAEPSAAPGSVDGVVFKPYAPNHAPTRGKARHGVRNASAKTPRQPAKVADAAAPAAPAKPEGETAPASGPASPVGAPKADAAAAAPAPQQPVAAAPVPVNAASVAAPIPVAAVQPAPAPPAIPAVPAVAHPPAAAMSAPAPAALPSAAVIPAADISRSGQASSAPASAPSPVRAVAGGNGNVVSIVFPADAVQLPNNADADLTALAQKMAKDESLNLQLLAYAQGDESNISKARRLSLSRALEVRKYLMEQGIRSTRIDVRALGNKIEGDGPPDRVDAVLSNH
ncbi:MAG: OmpA family protein [Magnetospirillum sp.]|nr:OmpA family protein [Magnetospirillum sp.]